MQMNTIKGRIFQLLLSVIRMKFLYQKILINAIHFC